MNQMGNKTMHESLPVDGHRVVDTCTANVALVQHDHALGATAMAARDQRATVDIPPAQSTLAQVSQRVVVQSMRRVIWEFISCLHSDHLSSPAAPGAHAWTIWA